MPNNLDKQYTELLKDILENGVKKETRNGGTISVFGRQIRHNMKDGFPLLTTKKMPFKTIVTELLWFLRGDTNIKYLVDNNCHIWDGDAYKNYEKAFNEGKVGGLSPMVKGVPDEIIPKELFIEMIKNCDELGSEEFAKKWGELGPIYGKQWREWTYLTREQKEDVDGIDELICGADMWDGIRHYRTFDQIQNLINDLKTNPDSRRLMVNSWNVGELDQMTLPPCHYGFQVYTRELSLDEMKGLLSKSLSKRFPPLSVNVFMKMGDGYDEFKEILETENIPTRAISLMWNQRSVDTFLGLPFNIASYGLLLEIIAKEVNMVPDELIGNLGDVHLYSNHVDQTMEQIGRDLTDEERYDIWFNNNYETGMERYFDPNNLPDYENEYYDPTPKRTREPFPLPTLKLGHFGSILENISVVDSSDFIIENYKSHETIKAPLSN